MDQFINQYFDWSSARPYLPDLARGFRVTIQIAVLAEILCLSLGMVLAVHARRVAARARARAGPPAPWRAPSP